MRAIAYLILIELTIFVLLLTLVLKCDDNETDEDVHHEEGDHDDVDDIEDRDDGPVVDGRSQILGARIDGDVQQAMELREEIRLRNWKRVGNEKFEEEPMF